MQHLNKLEESPPYYHWMALLLRDRFNDNGMETRFTLDGIQIDVPTRALDTIVKSHDVPYFRTSLKLQTEKLKCRRESNVPPKVKDMGSSKSVSFEVGNQWHTGGPKEFMTKVVHHFLRVENYKHALINMLMT